MGHIGPDIIAINHGATSVKAVYYGADYIWPPRLPTPVARGPVAAWTPAAPAGTYEFDHYSVIAHPPSQDAKFHEDAIHFSFREDLAQTITMGASTVEHGMPVGVELDTDGYAYELPGQTQNWDIEDDDTTGHSTRVLAFRFFIHDLPPTNFNLGFIRRGTRGGDGYELGLSSTGLFSLHSSGTPQSWLQGEGYYVTPTPLALGMHTIAVVADEQSYWGNKYPLDTVYIDGVAIPTRMKVNPLGQSGGYENVMDISVTLNSHIGVNDLNFLAPAPPDIAARIKAWHDGQVSLMPHGLA